MSIQPKFENVEGAFLVVLPNIHAQTLGIDNERYLPIHRLIEKQKEITRSDEERLFCFNIFELIKQHRNPAIIFLVQSVTFVELLPHLKQIHLCSFKETL